MSRHTEEQYRAFAQDYHTIDGEVEVEDNAPVSMGDGPGAYVQAWLWISDDEINDAREEDE